MANKAGTQRPKQAAADGSRKGRFRQGLKDMGTLAGIIRRANPRALPIIAATAIGIIAVAVVVGLLTHTTGFLIPLGVLVGLLAAMIEFRRFGASAQYAALAGDPTAVARVLLTMENVRGLRGGWTATPQVAFNRNQDMVHRVVGKPGVVLVSQGSPSRVPSLLAAEKKRVARVAYDVPIYDIQVGDEPGQVPLPKLQSHIMKLPKNLKGPAVADLNYRLKALPQTPPIPKGPLPKAGRMPRAPRPKFR
jgi:hypothetical protein